jgi:hypothetical protein
MREERLTVASFYPPGWHGSAPYRAVPFLPLAGPWLRAAGFSVGAEVRAVVVREGEVRVTLRELDGEET